MKTWKDYNKEIDNYKKFREIEKFMIYVEYEGIYQLTEEANDFLVNMACEMRHNWDYSTVTGMGIAVVNAISHIIDDCKLDEEHGAFDDELLSHVILNTPAEVIKEYIVDAWSYGDWQ